MGQSHENRSLSNRGMYFRNFLMHRTLNKFFTYMIFTCMIHPFKIHIYILEYSGFVSPRIHCVRGAHSTSENCIRDVAGLKKWISLVIFIPGHTVYGSAELIQVRKHDCAVTKQIVFQRYTDTFPLTNFVFQICKLTLLDKHVHIIVAFDLFSIPPKWLT